MRFAFGRDFVAEEPQKNKFPLPHGDFFLPTASLNYRFPGESVCIFLVLPFLRIFGVSLMRRFELFSACFASLFAASCATVPEYRDDEITTAEVIASIKCELRDAAWRLHPEN